MELNCSYDFLNLIFINLETKQNHFWPELYHTRNSEPAVTHL